MKNIRKIPIKDLPCCVQSPVLPLLSYFWFCFCCPPARPFQADISEELIDSHNFASLDSYQEREDTVESQRRSRRRFYSEGEDYQYGYSQSLSCDMGFFDENNPFINKWVRRFSDNNSGRKDMQRYLERSARYLPLMESILENQGVGRNLAYVAMAESGYNAYAVSSKNAVGYWQFIASTGRRYGLRIDKYVDERRDFYLSTKAAGKYLSELCSMFGSWPLALAAYNAGEGRISALVKKHGSDFWLLARRGKLPRETANFVPKIIAMRKISERPWHYGFSQLRYQSPLDYQIVEFKRPLSLKSLARAANVPYEEVARLNPKYKTAAVPVYGSKVALRIPSYTGF